MEFDSLIQQGWARHDSATEAVTTELETHRSLADAVEKARRFCALANHTIGEHLADWPRAEALLASVLEPLADDALSLGNWAVARYMAGQTAAALATETRAASLAESALASVIRTRMLLASALLGSGRQPESAELYGAALALARSVDDVSPFARAVAVVSNNLASELLDRASRTSEEAELMAEAACAAREFWLQAGTWVHAERADYLLARVLNALERFDEGLDCAQRGLETIRSHGGGQPVDEAFLELAAAEAARGLNQPTQSAEALARADVLAGAFEGEGLRKWFAGERAKVV